MTSMFNIAKCITTFNNLFTCNKYQISYRIFNFPTSPIIYLYQQRNRKTVLVVLLSDRLLLLVFVHPIIYIKHNHSLFHYIIPSHTSYFLANIAVYISSNVNPISEVESTTTFVRSIVGSLRGNGDREQSRDATLG